MPLQGGSLLFTTEAPRILGAQLIQLQTMEGCIKPSKNHETITKPPIQSNSFSTNAILSTFMAITFHFPYNHQKTYGFLMISGGNKQLNPLNLLNIRSEI